MMTEQEERKMQAMASTIREMRDEIRQLSLAANKRADSERWCREYDDWVNATLEQLPNVYEHWQRRAVVVNVNRIVLSLDTQGHQIYVEGDTDMGSDFQEELKKAVFASLEGTSIQDFELKEVHEEEGGVFEW